MKIVLIGFMGSGKSTVAELCAPRLLLDPIEMDSRVLSISGRQSINEIFEKDGEDRFRALESEVAGSLASADNCIVSTGGGAILAEENIVALRQNDAIFVYLRTGFTELSQRLKNFSNRPLFSDPAAARRTYEGREPKYRSVADIIIDTDGKSPNAVASELEERVFRFSLSERGDRSTLDKLDTRKLLLVIGDPISHSRSPRMHEAMLKAAGLSGMYQFRALRVKEEELADFMRYVRTGKIRGISVTMPHKQLIKKYLDSTDSSADAIGAVNTVIVDRSELRGCNTDWYGVVEPLKKRVALLGKEVAVLGAGGAARAAVYGLCREGAKVTVINRNRERAEKLVTDLGATACVGTLQDIARAEIVINATSLGMRQGETPVSAAQLGKPTFVFDLVYNRLETELLTMARNVGAKIVSGWEMFVEQGMRQFSLYTDAKANFEIMREAVLTDLSSGSK